MFKEQKSKIKEKALENINLLVEIEEIICNIIDDKIDTNSNRVSEQDQHDMKLIKHYFYHLKDSGKIHMSIDTNIVDVAIKIAASLKKELVSKTGNTKNLNVNDEFLKKYIFSWFNIYGLEMCNDGEIYHQTEQANQVKIAEFISADVLAEFHRLQENHERDREFLIDLGKSLYQAIKITNISSVAIYFKVSYQFLSDIYYNYLKPEFDRKP